MYQKAWRPNERTDKPEAICTPHPTLTFFKVGGITNDESSTAVFSRLSLARWLPRWEREIVSFFFFFFFSVCGMSPICHWLIFITKTYLYNFDPLKSHFYIVKLGFTGVNIIFLISAQKIDCGYSLEPPPRGGSNDYARSIFWAKIWKISEFLSENFSFW